MKNEDLILLLQLIKKNGNIDNMIKQGYQYSQVAKFISHLIENNYVVFTDERILLSVKGDELLKSLNKKFQRKNSESFISPQLEYKLDVKKNIYDIYLPDSHKSLG